MPKLGGAWSRRASEVALPFVEAYSAGDEQAVVEVLDTSVPPDPEFPVQLAPGAEAKVIGKNAQGGRVVLFACGNEVNG